jgi:hypothetical protein
MFSPDSLKYNVGRKFTLEIIPIDAIFDLSSDPVSKKNASSAGLPTYQLRVNFRDNENIFPNK